MVKVADELGLQAQGRLSKERGKREARQVGSGA